MSYVPLGIRTEYSFFDGLCRVPSLVERARAMRFDAIGVADLHSTLALPRLQLAAREAGLRAIHGARVRLLPELPAQLFWGQVQPEIQLLATDARGLRNLFRLVSRAPERGEGELLTLTDLENAAASCW
jgi:DNA polymerase-3 subunit alpha